MAPSYGHWERENDYAALASPPAPVHSGDWSVVVDTMNASTGSFVVQDVDIPELSYRLAFWVRPEAGINAVTLVFNWGRGVYGNQQFSTRVSFSPTETALQGWGTSRSFRPLAFGSWHGILVVANRCTRVQELSVDAGVVGNVTGTDPFPTGNSTVVFGDFLGTAYHGRYYWDDFSLETFDCSPPHTLVADAGGPYVGLEGTPVTLSAGNSSDSAGHPLQFRWDFLNDGTWDTSWSSSPVASYTWGDVWVGRARLEVTDGNLTANATASVTIGNVPPVILDARASATANVTLRVAGEKWHDVLLFVNQSGASRSVRVVRTPGNPNAQEATLTNVTLDMTRNVSVVALYTPADDPVNGQPNGANPAWIIFTTPSGEVRLHHTFNVRQPASWTWTVENVVPLIASMGFRVSVTAHDVGSDDLYFRVSWGDGGSSTAVVYNNGVGPDPYPSPDVHPITATETFPHAYAVSRSYTITVTVTDDDGASVTQGLVVPA